MAKVYFREINQKLVELNLWKATSALSYYIELILECYSYEELKELEDIVEYNIVRYFEEELDRKVEELKEWYKYEGWYDDNGYWQSEYEQYFEFDCDGGMLPVEWLIINDFDVPYRDNEDDLETLEWLLEIGDFNYGDVMPMNFQIMAVQAAIYLKNLCNEPYNISHLSNAYLALRASEKLSSEFEMKGELLAAEQKARNAITEKAVKARHFESNKVKAMVIQKWRKYKQQKEEQGKKASKTDFAKRIYDELQKAHNQAPDKNKAYSLKTIRNNWLQGID